MSNCTLISFEDADYSKGSHKLVIWTCPRCQTEFKKAYKQALKTKHCKPCNNILRPKKCKKGKNNPFYGKKHTKETIKSLSGKSNSNWKGGLPYCQHKDCTAQLSDARSSYCMKHQQLGKRNPNWNPTYNRAIREQLRINPEYIQWAKDVKARDNYTCQHCGVTNTTLHSHHIKLFSKYPDLRYDLDNGLTLCKPCHFKVHAKD